MSVCVCVCVVSTKVGEHMLTCNWRRWRTAKCLMHTFLRSLSESLRFRVLSVLHLALCFSMTCLFMLLYSPGRMVGVG